MNKQITDAISYLTVPALFVGYYFTHSMAFLFIYGLLSVLAFSMYVALFIAHDFIKQSAAYKKALVNLTSRQIWLGRLWYLAILGFLICESCFFLAALTFINAALSAFWTCTIRSEKK